MTHGLDGDAVRGHRWPQREEHRIGRGGQSAGLIKQSNMLIFELSLRAGSHVLPAAGAVVYNFKYVEFFNGWR